MNKRRWLVVLTAAAFAAPLTCCGSASPVSISSSPAVAATATATAAVAPTSVPSSTHTLLVTGTGEVSAPPNQVVINLGVDAQGASAPLAMNQASVDMSRLLAALKREGVQAADISTTELSLYREYNAPYQASQSVDVTIHHISNAGAVIAAGMNAVGNDATVSGVTYSILDPSSQITAARARAMASARTEAVQLAQLAGQHLGAVVSVSDELIGSASTGGCSEGCGGAGGSVPLSPGVDQISVTIYVTFAMS